MLSLAELERMVAAGDVDTVILAFADMQGRLVGKRVSGRDFVDEFAAHGAECCNYLLAVDVDMNTVAGYAMSSWDTGYGDMVMTPDLGTLRLIPWLPGTALVHNRFGLARRQRGRRRAAQHPAPPAQRLSQQGLAANVATELEFMVFDDTYRQHGPAATAG